MVTNVTVFLYQDSKSDNFNRIKKITGNTIQEKLTNQNTYFDGLNKIRVDGTFNKFGEKILLNGNITQFLNCGYGRFEYYGKYFYFSISDFEVCNDSKTYMIYRFDYYETARFQYGLTFGKGTVIKSNYNYNYIRQKPLLSDGLGKKELIYLKRYDNVYGVLFYIWDDSNNYGKICLLKGQNLYHHIIHGYYIQSLTDAGVISTENQIKGAWVIPKGFLNDDPTNNGFVLRGNQGTVYEYNTTNLTPITGVMNGYSYPVGDTPAVYLTIGRSNTYHSIVKDSRNLTLWEFPTGFIGTLNVIPEWVLNISPTSASFKVFFNVDNTMHNVDDNDYYFVYNCDTLPVFNDTYKEYAYRQRESDIRNRQIQNEQQTLNSLLNVGTSVISGGIAGGSVGMTGMGAVGGAISGTVSAVGSYFINDYYGNQVQDVLDKTYERAQDQLLLQGDGLNQFTEKGKWGFFNEYYMGDWGTHRIDAMQTCYGYDVYVQSSDIDDYINSMNNQSGSNFVMGDFEILGNFPSVWKRQIQDRFKQGVTFGL